METIYRQKHDNELTATLLKEKLAHDADYEIAVRNLYSNAKLAQADKRAQKAALWANYQTWAINAGAYEAVPPEKQLAEAEAALVDQVVSVNTMRVALSKTVLTLATAAPSEISTKET